jgi:hypothetical protein
VFFHNHAVLCFSFSDILKQRTEDVEIKRYAVSYMKGMGSFTYTVGVLNSIETQLRTEIAKLGGNPVLEAILYELTSTVNVEPQSDSAATSSTPSSSFGSGPIPPTASASPIHLSIENRPDVVLRLSHDDVSQQQL